MAGMEHGDFCSINWPVRIRVDDNSPSGREKGRRGGIEGVENPVGN